MCQRYFSRVTMRDKGMEHWLYDWQTGQKTLTSSTEWDAETNKHNGEEIKINNDISGSKKSSKIANITGNWRLKVGAADAAQFPSNGFKSKGLNPDVAFVGRSNVGKSTLINALLCQKIAHTSKTPGRTQQINFFYRPPAETSFIVDLPGYGFGKAPVKSVHSWNILIGSYAREREALVRMFALIDGRRGLKRHDMEFLHFLEEFQVPHQLVVTKVDRISSQELEDCVSGISEHIRSQRASHCEPLIYPVSSKTGFGVESLRSLIAKLLTMPVV